MEFQAFDWLKSSQGIFDGGGRKGLGFHHLRFFIYIKYQSCKEHGFLVVGTVQP
jgi:hypothetical protein